MQPEKNTFKKIKLRKLHTGHTGLPGNLYTTNTNTSFESCLHCPC